MWPELSQVYGKSTLFTKKWTKGRKNGQNILRYFATKKRNKHKYA